MDIDVSMIEIETAKTCVCKIDFVTFDQKPRLYSYSKPNLAIE